MHLDGDVLIRDEEESMLKTRLRQQEKRLGEFQERSRQMSLVQKSRNLIHERSLLEQGLLGECGRMLEHVIVLRALAGQADRERWQNGPPPLARPVSADTSDVECVLQEDDPSVKDAEAHLRVVMERLFAKQCHIAALIAQRCGVAEVEAASTQLRCRFDLDLWEPKRIRSATESITSFCLANEGVDPAQVRVITANGELVEPPYNDNDLLPEGSTVLVPLSLHERFRRCLISQQHQAYLLLDVDSEAEPHLYRIRKEELYRRIAASDAAFLLVEEAEARLKTARVNTTFTIFSSVVSFYDQCHLYFDELVSIHEAYLEYLASAFFEIDPAGAVAGSGTVGELRAVTKDFRRLCQRLQEKAQLLATPALELDQNVS